MLTEGRIIIHESLGAEEQRLRRLVLKGPFARKAKAGQFVSLQVRRPELSSYDPLLRRPISLAEISADREEVTLLYKIVGRGTEILAQAKCGESLSVLGPLGNGFSLPGEGELWLVAGGIGIFPLYPLAQSALAQGLRVRLFWGGEDRAFLESAGLQSWRNLGIPCHLSTLDGSLGQKGLVTELLSEGLTAEDEPKPAGRKIRAAACGPKKMLQAVTGWCLKTGIETEVSLEERMGCAVGACLGCVCTVRDEKGSLVRKKVCQDGPVFRGEEVVWDESC